jgi:YesN/AraC family two-component response regulator
MLDITLLIADDEEELIENVLYDLKKTVKTIITASNGAEALIKLKENKVDIVISDINMPQKNGITFATEAREWGYSLPFIFLTAHGDDELMKKALSLGAFDFIDKPYEKDSLIEILKEAAEESTKIQNSLLSDNDLDNEFKRSYIGLLKSS